MAAGRRSGNQRLGVSVPRRHVPPISKTEPARTQAHLEGNRRLVLTCSMAVGQLAAGVQVAAITPGADQVSPWSTAARRLSLPPGSCRVLQWYLKGERGLGWQFRDALGQGYRGAGMRKLQRLGGEVKAALPWGEKNLPAKPAEDDWKVGWGRCPIGVVQAALDGQRGLMPA